jgi:KUP system potassium uptake protein
MTGGEGPPLAGDERPPGDERAPGDEPARGRVGAAGSAGRSGIAALTLAALGVVFGDIGTSPLYALHAVFTFDNHAVKPTQVGVYGVISLVFWAITIIVSLKYVTFILRADNDGEGGIMALIALIQGINFRSRKVAAALVGVGIFGASLFYGDGMITPAISVLSAVEGLEVAAPSLESVVVPITLVVLTVLFFIQRFGTGAVGRLFGPVMAVWFGLLAVSGLGRIVHDPGVFRALSPSYGVEFFADHGGIAFVALGSVVLAVTGAEALYADLGHFGRPPIRRAWFFLVFPALTLNYLGQGSLIVHKPQAIDNPFFLLVPHWSRIPLVVLATFATVIASQAVISGAFSVTRQAVQLGFLPRLRITHTSEREVGQVYAPGINMLLFAGVVTLVVAFGSSAALASAYGIAVTGTLAIDTVLFFVVVRCLWHKPLPLVIGGATAFLFVDLSFFAANLPKIAHGGWFPLTIALVVFTLLMTWRRGREIVTERRTEQEGALDEFIEEVREMEPRVFRPQRTAIFLSQGKATTPLALRANLDHNRTLHSSVVIVSVDMQRVPHVPPDERVTVDSLGYEDDGIVHMTLRFGFQDDPDVPRALREAVAVHELECEVDLEEASYFLSRATIVQSDEKPGMSRWREKLFVGMTRTAASPVEYFGLPPDRIVTMGGYIEV